MASWPTTYLTKPTFSNAVIESFQNAGNKIPEADATIVTWWDYGYTSMLSNGYPTLHDGGSAACHPPF